MQHHPIDPFLASWAESGGVDGVDLRLRVYRVLSLDREWTRSLLKLRLRVVLALDEAERDRFDALFDRFFPEHEIPPWLQARLGGESFSIDKAAPRRLDPTRAADEITSALSRPSESVQAPAPRPSTPSSAPVSPRKPGRKPPATQGRQVALAIALGVFFGALLILGVRWLEPGPQTVDAGAPDASADVVEGDSAVVQTPAMTPILIEPDAGAGPPPTLTERLTASRGPAWAGWAFAAFGALALLGVTGALAARYRYHNPPLPRPRRFEEGRDLRITGAPSPWLPAEKEAVLANRVGRLRESEPTVLDLAKTVESTARNAGCLSPEYRSERGPPAACFVLIHPLDAIARRALEECRRILRKAGVRERVAESGPFEDGESRLVVVNGLRRDPGTLDALLSSPHVAVIEARDRRFWGPEVARYRTAPFTLDPEGIGKAFRAAAEGRRAPPLRVGSAPQGRMVLGDALPLAAACALAEPCDLGSMDEARMLFCPKLPHLAMQRIIALRGVTADVVAGIRFEPDLRAWLIESVGPDFQLRVLEWHRKRLRGVVVQEGSRAEAMLEREVSLASLQIATLRAQVSEPSPAVSESDRASGKGAEAASETPSPSPEEALLEIDGAVAEIESQLASEPLRRPLLRRLGNVARVTFARDVPRAKGLVDGWLRLSRHLRRAGMLPLGALRWLAGIERWRLGALVLAATACFAASMGFFKVARQCDTGSAWCVEPSRGGACKDLQSDPAHCGSCDSPCPSSRACVLGQCACEAGQSRCGKDCVDLQTDKDNCGACGATCGDQGQCVAGICDCSGELTKCDGKCVNLNTDPRSCGQCGRSCAANEKCERGVCRPVCSPGKADCDGKSENGCETDTDSDPDNCGECALNCKEEPGIARVCVNGRCNHACDATHEDCDKLPGNGCETEIANGDPANCGACGKQCPSGGPQQMVTCVNSRCKYRCEEGFKSCNDINDDGCEVNLLADKRNCGSCGNVCPAPRADWCQDVKCDQGECRTPCKPECADCDGLLSTGCEVKIKEDVNNCGGCRKTCPSPSPAFCMDVACKDGGCALSCKPECADCDKNAANGCEAKIKTDVNHCGACGTACATPPPANCQVVSCVGGQCQTSCGAGCVDCNKQAADGCEARIQSDVHNCGGCGTACRLPGPSEKITCVNGLCVDSCDANCADCDGLRQNGCEAKLLQDPRNCGECGIACGSDQACVSGVCVTPKGSEGQPPPDAGPKN